VARPLERRSLRDQIREQVLARILDGTYAPGSRVVESKIAHEFGTSQAPVREALRDLEGMRLIETQPHVGARVREVTAQELGQIYPVLAALEEVAARQAAARITDKVLAQLQAELDAMRAAAEKRDARDQMVHDARFHELIVESSGNLVLLEVWRTLQVKGRSLISMLNADLDLGVVSEMHQPIVAALQYRDADLAGNEMRTLIDFFGSLINTGAGVPG
jgi:DNA-binding GntR family transcriptional regulator